MLLQNKIHKLIVLNTKDKSRLWQTCSVSLRIPLEKKSLILITSLVRHNNVIKVYVMAKLIGMFYNLGVLHRPLVIC